MARRGAGEGRGGGIRAGIDGMGIGLRRPSFINGVCVPFKVMKVYSKICRRYLTNNIYVLQSTFAHKY